MKGLKCVRIPELKYAHLCSESTSLSLRMTFSDSNMTLKISNKFKHDSFTFNFSSGKAHFVVVTCLRQGFSYYCQFSPKNLQSSKWSKSGKKGSKHLIICMSMAYKVIECIVFTKNTKSLFSLYKTSEITKNSPKKRSLNRDFLITFK